MTVDEFNNIITKTNWITENRIGWRFSPRMNLIYIATDGKQEVLKYDTIEHNGAIHFIDSQLSTNEFRVELSEDHQTLTLFTSTPTVLKATPIPSKPKPDKSK